MSKASQSTPAPRSTRRASTGVDASGALPVEYRFSHARGGSRHLLVVFADFAAPGGYGWSDGVLDDIRSNVLWIRDDFDGAHTYYLCRGMDFSLEQSVAGLISRVMGALSLSPDQVTLFGSSKGASAALFFGLKYGLRNIVAKAPQFQIGTFVKEGKPETARVMMGEPSDRGVHVLDSILPDLVRSGANPAANIYLIASAQDVQYQRQVEPFVGLFQGRENFNFLYDDSARGAAKGKEAPRDLPTLMALLTLLVDGMAPRIGMVRGGLEQPGRDTSAIDAYLKQTSQVRGADTFPKPVVVTPRAQERVPANTVRFTGSAPGAVRVSFWLDGKHQGSAPVAPDGSWMWERSSPWPKGKNVVRLFAADANNYQTQRAEVTFIAVEHAAEPQPAYAPAQQQPPAQQLALSVTAPVAHQRLTNPAAGFAGYAPGAVRVDLQEAGMRLGTCEVRPDGSWVWEPGWAWNEGDHFVEVVAVDAVGTTSAWASVPFTVTAMYSAPAQGRYFNQRY
ncbi:hypothetical protein [Streptomyces sp. NPDC047014]|uniref:hypothetical protein n=1 Tax=Streptomyces sp. NPDC047014 TaxID=3155736 RepID=UPI0033EF9A3F